MEYGFDSYGSISRTGFSFPCFLDGKKFFYGIGRIVCESSGFSAAKYHAAKLSGSFVADGSMASVAQLLRDNVAICDGNGDFIQSDSIWIFKI